MEHLVRKHHRYPPNRVLLTLRGSRGEDHASAEEIEARSSVALVLDLSIGVEIWLWRTFGAAADES